MSAKGIFFCVTLGISILLHQPTPSPAQDAFATVAQPLPALVEFNNNVDFRTPGDRLVRWYDGSPLTGTNYAAQLYYGFNVSNLLPLPDPPVRFRIHTTTAPGTWLGAIRTLPGVVPGTPIKLQVKVWDLRHGATFEEAANRGLFAFASLPFDYTPPVNALTPAEFYMENFRSSMWLSCPMFPTPIIHVHPTSQTVRAGTNVTLRVVAEYPCHTDWYFNGALLTGTYPNSTLTISNVQPANVGDYYARVINFNGFASATSQVARVTLIGQPRLSSITHLAGGFSFEVPASAGETFVIETATNLTPPTVWIPISTNTAPFSFTNSTATDHQRFYRTVFR